MRFVDELSRRTPGFLEGDVWLAVANSDVLWLLPWFLLLASMFVYACAPTRGTSWAAQGTLGVLYVVIVVALVQSYQPPAETWSVRQLAFFHEARVKMGLPSLMSKDIRRHHVHSTYRKLVERLEARTTLLRRLG